MYVLKPNNGNLAFIAHPRTASRAAAGVLLACGAQMVNGHHRFDENLCASISESNGTVACVVRNMFDVMVSWWHNMTFHDGTDKPLRPDYQTFGEYVGQQANEPTGKYFRTPLYHYGLPHSNFVLRYEHLQVDLYTLLMSCQLTPRQLLVIGESKRSPYRDYYTPGLQSIVEERWGRDLELTGYEF